MQTRLGNKTRILLGLALLIPLGVAMWKAPTREWSIAFIRYVQNLGFIGFLLYAMAYVVGTILLFPGTLLTVGSGFLYGPVWGTVLVSPASVAGAAIAFILSRSFARDWIAEKIQKYPRFAAIDRAVGRHSFKAVLLLRLEPINLPFALLNYALGLTSVNLRNYVLASWLGMLPATILYVYAGSVVRDFAIFLRGGFSEVTSWQRLLFWGGLVATAGFVVFLTKLARRALRALDSPQVAGGCFCVRFASRRPRSLGVVAAGINLRTVLTHSATGDQAIFVRRSVFQEIGGFREWPLFEDVDFASRVKLEGRFVVIRSRVTLSARRHLRYGIFRTVMLVYLLRLGFWAGASPFTLARWYQDPDAHLKPSGVLGAATERYGISG